MNKLIAAIEALPSGHIKYIEYDEFGVWAGFHTVGVEGGLKTDDLKALVAQLKWIPVSERLPELEQIVLTTSEPLNTFQRDVDTARRTNDGWRWGDDSRVSSGWTIVAWMPLPEVYKESK